MGATVVVNKRTVVHSGSGGTGPSVPDFCKTPAPPGPPIPIPYPNLGSSSDTADGSTTVKMDGNPIMLKKSKFSRSSGDEAGTLKGVASNTNMGVLKFANYSFDVKVDGQTVPRLGDPMTNNGNGANTTTVAELQAATGLSDIDMTDDQVKAICEAFCETQDEYNRGELPKEPGCCSRRLQEKLQALGSPNILSEQAAIIGKYGGNVVTPNLIEGVLETALQTTGSTLGGPLGQILGWTAGMASGAAVPTWMANRFITAIAGQGIAAWNRIPDIVTNNPLTGGGEVLDAKFRWKKGADSLSDAQARDYPKLNDGKQPIVVDEKACGCT